MRRGYEIARRRIAGVELLLCKAGCGLQQIDRGQAHALEFERRIFARCEVRAIELLELEPEIVDARIALARITAERLHGFVALAQQLPRGLHRGGLAGGAPEQIEDLEVTRGIDEPLVLMLARKIDQQRAELAEPGRRGQRAVARRKLWEAAITKDPVAREGLARISRIFALDRSFRGKPASEIKSLRELHIRAHTDAFFECVAFEYDKVRAQRGLLRTALGYAHRQREPLTTFYDDGRLKLDNNSSERELRRIAVGRKNWLFLGSDDHAQAAGNLLTLIATARLHRLDPELYLRDLIRVLPYWPRERFLELCPRDWIATRARLDAAGPVDDCDASGCAGAGSGPRCDARSVIPS